MASLVPKPQEVASTCEDVVKMKPLCTVDGDANCAAAVENSMEAPQKSKNRTSDQMIQQLHSWVFMGRKQKPYFGHIFAPPCLLPHYLQYSR